MKWFYVSHWADLINWTYPLNPLNGSLYYISWDMITLPTVRSSNKKVVLQLTSIFMNSIRTIWNYHIIIAIGDICNIIYQLSDECNTPQQNTDVHVSNTSGFAPNSNINWYLTMHITFCKYKSATNISQVYSYVSHFISCLITFLEWPKSAYICNTICIV